MNKSPAAPASLPALMKAYPWLPVLLAASLLVTVWAATRRAPPPPAPILPAVEPVVAAPPLASEPEPAPVEWPASQAAPEPVAEQAPPPPPRSSEARPPLPVDPAAPLAGAQRPDGTWEPGPGAPRVAP